MNNEPRSTMRKITAQEVLLLSLPRKKYAFSDIFGCIWLESLHPLIQETYEYSRSAKKNPQGGHTNAGKQHELVQRAVTHTWTWTSGSAARVKSQASTKPSSPVRSAPWVYKSQQPSAGGCQQANPPQAGWWFPCLCWQMPHQGRWCG